MTLLNADNAVVYPGKGKAVLLRKIDIQLSHPGVFVMKAAEKGMATTGPVV